MTLLKLKGPRDQGPINIEILYWVYAPKSIDIYQMKQKLFKLYNENVIQ